MHNPFLLQNFKSQGFSYMLFDDENQKKACNGDGILQKKQNVPQTATSTNTVTEPSPHIPQSPARLYQSQTAKEPTAFSKTSFTALSEQKTVNSVAPKSKKQALAPDIPLNPLKEHTLPFEEWIISWKEAHKRCNLPFLRPQNLSRQIVWTYKGLEEDLFTDNPSDKRRQLLAQIIKTLSFPKGTHIFLPYRLINQNGQSEPAIMERENREYSFFWSAINHVRPRVLVVFGEDARSEINLPPMLPTQKHTIMPVIVYALDNIMLYADNAQENAIMMNFLISNLKAFA